MGKEERVDFGFSWRRKKVRELLLLIVKAR